MMKLVRTTRRIRRGWLAAGMAVVMVSSTAPAAFAAPAGAGGSFTRLGPQAEPVVPVKPVPVRPAEPDPVTTAARVGRLPVHVARIGAAEPRAADAPTSVRVEVLDRAAARAVGVAGLLLRVRRSDRRTGKGPVRLSVNYASFRNAYGAEWDSRLRLVRLPNTVLPGHNDTASGVVTADLDVSDNDTLVALDAGPSGPGGDFRAKPPALSGSWQLSVQTGEFTWNYPLRMPPTPGNLAPQFALAYSSGAVDGRTASANNQPSWVGEGFDLWSGYVQRSYRSCADDREGGNNTEETGDECWFSDNATLSLAGHSGELVRVGTTQTWRLRRDDGTRIQRLFGVVNGDNDKEYWKVSTTDGTQYFFGAKPETQSTWTVPVFGNHSGEPCHGSSYATSWCYQAYRWNLDHVVDRNGNTITYHYSRETNHYGLNRGASTVAYHRGGVLLRAEFGTRTGSAAVPAKVVFETANRCVPGKNCAEHSPEAYPDVPYDQECTANCTTRVSPTFWITQRLSKVTTYVGTTPVESWTLGHEYPDSNPGDAQSAVLWLDSISHTGLVGGTAQLPAVTFSGIAMQNRVEPYNDDSGVSPMSKYRLLSIHNEAGGVTTVNYAPTDCTRDALPPVDRNTLRCFPVYWQPEGEPPLTDWMNKYVVASVTEVDLVGGSPTEVTSYDYLDGAAWHHADDPILTDKQRTWSQWRGYERVVVRHGDPALTTESATEYRYFRGMNGDRMADGSTRTASVEDTLGGTVRDDEQLNGFLREQVSYADASLQKILGSTINDPWQHGPTATQGYLKAFMVDTGTVHVRTALDGDGNWRRTRVSRAYNDDGSVTQIHDEGDLAVADDQECTRIWYARNETSWLLSLPYRQQTVATSCPTGTEHTYPAVLPMSARDAVSQVNTYYDDSTSLGAVPSAGRATRVDQLKEIPQGGTPTFVTVTRTSYDDYGRPKETTDALGRKTSTTYTDVDGVTTKLTVTNALDQQTHTELAPAWGEPTALIDVGGLRTDISYDPLGRVTGVWLPGRDKAAGWGPHTRYTHSVTKDGPTSVRTDTLRANGNYVTAYILYDGFLRPRQTQSPGWDHQGALGRVVTDTIHDSRGLVVKNSGPYYAEGDPGSALVAAGDNNIATQTVTVYDGAERPTESIFRSNGVEQWRSTTAYHGDHINRTPPPGGTATTEYLDADGRTVKLLQYHGPEPTGTADTTEYTYTRTGQLASVTDPAGNRWSYGYDLRGRRTVTDDPDSGRSTSVYDDAGQLTGTTDAEGKTVVVRYDEIGRKIEEWKDAIGTGTLLASWTYDTLRAGQLTSSARYTGGSAYVTRVTEFEATTNRPTKTSVVIPGAELGLAGTYETNFTYRVDGSVASVELRNPGGLENEKLLYGYDTLGLAKNLTSSAGTTYVHSTAYTRFGELAELVLGAPGAQVTDNLYYDVPTRRLAESKVQREYATEAQVNDFHYRYDPAGNLIRLSDVPEGGPSDVQCFGYDHLRRMTEAWTATDDCAAPPSDAVVGGIAPYWTSYEYDATGNRRREVQHGLGGVGDTTRTYGYPAAAQPQPHAVGSVTTAGPGGSRLDSFTYDRAGRTLTRNLAGSTQTLTWDPTGRLASVRAPEGDTAFVYDATGNRLLRAEPGAKTLYLGNREVRLDRTTGAKTYTRYYSHAGTVVAVRSDGVLSWQVADHHGTATTSIRAGDLAVTRRLFTPFGGTRGTAPASWPDQRGFVGGTQDPTTGLTHLGAREYDPATGRFISVDPIVDSADPQQLNGYAYANNNPTSMSDPDGLKYFVDFEGRVTAPAARGQTKKVMQRVEQRLKRYRAMYRAWSKQISARKVHRQRAVAASGHTQEEYEEALEIKKKTVFDVAVEAGGQVLMEFLGVNDIKDCFGQGDLGACVSMVINVIPWSKLSRLGDLISSVKRAFNAVMNFRQQQKHADEVIEAVESCLVGGHSFRPDTRVRLADGSTVPIGEVRLGDTVLATDPVTGRTEARTVVALHVNNDHEFVDLRVREAGDRDVETIHTTESHPFWLDARREWVDADQLRAGDVLRTPGGRRVTVVELVRFTGAQLMRDLTVDGIHTYYVLAGDTPVLVHNTGGRTGPDFTIAGDYTGRVDRFTYRGQAYFEVHVYHKGTEVGIYGSNGWIGKHGHSANMNLGDVVENRLKGVAIDEMRRAGRLGRNEAIKGDSWKRPHVDRPC